MFLGSPHGGEAKWKVEGKVKSGREKWKGKKGLTGAQAPCGTLGAGIEHAPNYPRQFATAGAFTHQLMSQLVWNCSQDVQPALWTGRFQKPNKGSREKRHRYLQLESTGHAWAWRVPWGHGWGPTAPAIRVLPNEEKNLSEVGSLRKFPWGIKSWKIVQILGRKEGESNSLDLWPGKSKGRQQQGNILPGVWWRLEGTEATLWRELSSQVSLSDLKIESRSPAPAKLLMYLIPGTRLFLLSRGYFKVLSCFQNSPDYRGRQWAFHHWVLSFRVIRP